MLKDAGDKAPKIVNVFIEITKGSNIKYEYDEKAEVLKVDRILHTSMVYPFNYGFIPGAPGEDGDPIDILVISAAQFAPGTYVKARPIGALIMKDEEGIDTKIVAVPVEKVDPQYKDISDIKQINESTIAMIKHFFSYYKTLEPGKWVEITGWEGAEKAQKMVSDAITKGRKKK